MPSPATHYRWRRVLVNEYSTKVKISRFITPSKNVSVTTSSEESVTQPNDSHSNIATPVANHLQSASTITNDSHTVSRRSEPTSRDIAVAAMIFKVRRLQNNKDMDIFCHFLCSLNVQHVPRSMKAIQQQLHRDFNLSEYYKCFNICSECGESNPNNAIQCTLCDNQNLFRFYLYSIKQQIQQLLSTKGMYMKLKDERNKNIQLFSCTKYGKILEEINTDSFTMIINCDGICTPNKNLSLWPFVLTLNELPVPHRRYVENVIVAGTMSTGKKPTKAVFETCLDYICQELMKLELGQEFYINDIDERKILYFYTLASCTDKPAEALMENVASYNAEYGCPKCFHPGELYHGERGGGVRRKIFTIRVYPFADYQPRTQEKCCKIIQDLINYSDRTNNIIHNRAQNKTASRKNDVPPNSYGHAGCCPLTKLKYFNYGTSFLTDSLHTIYAGSFKKLLQLLFDPEHRQQHWSLFKKIKRIDELLSCVQIPSTTQRRFRSIKLIYKFKGSEFRCLLHFGSIAILQCMNHHTHKTLLLSYVTAINLASADYVTYETIELVNKLMNYFVEHFQIIFGLRHMNSNIHSLLHVTETLKLIGPLWTCSTFNYEGIDKDLINTVHGTIEFAKQLIRQHMLYRDAIIQHQSEQYPMSLFTFNEYLLDRKQTKIHYQNVVDGCSLPSPVSTELYDNSENGIATQVQSHFKDDLMFYHSLIISNLLVKTTALTYGKLFNDSCISFYFNHDQLKFGLIRAIVKSKQQIVRVFIEELIEKKPGSSKIKFKLNNEEYHVPNIFLLNRSNIFHLKHPKCILKKHALVYKPGNRITVLEYPNLKDNS